MEKIYLNSNQKDAELQVKRINKKRIAILIFVALIIIAIVSTISAYILNEEFRDFWDYTVLRKEVESSEVQSIYLEKTI